MKYPKLLRAVTWVAVTLAVSALAYFELCRVEEGRLFAFSLPHESPPSKYELIDAKISASDFKYLSVLAVAVIGFAFPGVYRSTKTRGRAQISRTLLCLFAVAVVADLATTIGFFHSQGIDHELHPGIRLFGYAYGRTIGPILGKAVQAAGVLFISTSIGRAGWILVAIVTAAYFAAAAYNLSQAI